MGTKYQVELTKHEVLALIWLLGKIEKKSLKMEDITFQSHETFEGVGHLLSDVYSSEQV